MSTQEITSKVRKLKRLQTKAEEIQVLQKTASNQTEYPSSFQGIPMG